VQTFRRRRASLSATAWLSCIRCDDTGVTAISSLQPFSDAVRRARRRSVEPTCCVDEQDANASVHWDVLRLPAVRRDGLVFGYTVSLCDQTASLNQVTYERKVRGSRDFGVSDKAVTADTENLALTALVKGHNIWQTAKPKLMTF